MTRLKRIFLPGWIILIMLLIQPMLLLEGATNTDHITKQGPYVDTIRYEIIQDQADAITALQNGEVEVIVDSIEPQHLEELEQSANIEVAKTNRNGYGFFLFNYERYPLNMTVLRRAAAFAFHKEKVANETWSGYAEPLDSPVPPMNPLSAEEELDYHYYETEVDRANSLLDAAGFEINETTGFREAPNGEPFDICIDASWNSQIQFSVAKVLEDAFENLHVDASAAQVDPYDMKCRTERFDIRLLENHFEDFNVDWLTSRLWVGGWDCLCPQYQPYQEILELRNATFRDWKEQLLTASSFEKIREAAVEIQKIIVYESPMIVAYNDKYLSAYRTDEFEEFVKGSHQGVESWWMPYHARLIETGGVHIGGTLEIAYPFRGIDSFNFMHAMFPVSDPIVQFFYDSLIRQKPDGDAINWFAKDYTIETHADNTSVPENHTRITFIMIQNATWTDGKPITAEDAAFSLNYYRDAPGNPYSTDLTNLTAAYANSPYTLEVEFNTESYWHLQRVGYKPIIPRHIFTQIGTEGWNTWNPNPPEEEMVTSGPFNVSEYVASEYCELSKNDNYPFRPEAVTSETTYTNDSTPTINLVEVGIVFSIGLIAVVAVGVVGRKIMSKVE